MTVRMRSRRLLRQQRQRRFPLRMLERRHKVLHLARGQPDFRTDGDSLPVRQGADDFRKYSQRFRRAERKVIGPPDQLRNAGDGPVLGGNQVCFRGRLV